MNKKIIAFGEIMLRLNPHEYYRFSQADDFAATYTGAEANVCAALSLAAARSLSPRFRIMTLRTARSRP